MSQTDYRSLLWELPPDLVKELIESGKDVNAPDSLGDYMLTVACQGLHASTVRLLLAAGADPNVRSDSGDTPLLCAIDTVQHNPAASMSIVEMLVTADADLERRGYMNKTPFLKACSRGNLDLVKLLVRLGADTTAVVDDGGILAGVEFARIFHAPREMTEYIDGLKRA